MRVTHGASPERRLLTIALAVFLLAAAAGIVVWAVVGTGSDDQPRAQIRTMTRTVTITKSAPATSLKAQMTQWFIGVEKNFDTVSADQDAIQGAADPTKLAVACHNLKRHIVTFEAATPAPEAGVRNYVARMLDAYSTAATQCLGGNFKSAAAHVITGSKWLGRAATRIKQLEGR